MSRLLLSLLAAAGLSCGCSLSPDVRTTRGIPPSRETRDAYVSCRAAPPIAKLPSDGPAGLADLLALVEEGSVEVRQARARLDAAAAGVAEARAGLLPNFSIGVNALSLARRPGSSGFFTDQSVADAAVELSVPLDVSGRLAASVRAAQARYRSAGEGLRARIREQRLTVVRAYFLLLEARDLALVNEAAVNLQERALRDGRARLEVGTVRRNDVLVIEVALSNSRQRAVTLSSAILDARRALNAAVGLPVDHATEVAPFDGLIPVETAVVPLLDRARRDNPEVDVLVETRAALLQELVANARADLPEVDVGPRLTLTTEGAAEPAENLAGFVAVSWNPDLNGRIQAERRGLKAQLLDLAWTVTGLLRQLEQQILRAHQRTIERSSALHAAETSLGQARENVRIVLEQFRAGVSTGREVLEAQALLSEQEGTVKVSRHQVNATQFELHWLAGVDPLDYAAQAAVLAETRPEAESRPESR
jgi:outer membrane protein TolC